MGGQAAKVERCSTLCYYRVLGVGAGCSREQVKTAYRGLAKRLHPDMQPSGQSALSARAAAQRFQLAQEAYQCLSGGESRLAYDTDPGFAFCHLCSSSTAPSAEQAHQAAKVSATFSAAASMSAAPPSPSVRGDIGRDDRPSSPTPSGRGGARRCGEAARGSGAPRAAAGASSGGSPQGPGPRSGPGTEWSRTAFAAGSGGGGQARTVQPARSGELPDKGSEKLANQPFEVLQHSRVGRSSLGRQAPADVYVDADGKVRHQRPSSDSQASSASAIFRVVG